MKCKQCGKEMTINLKFGISEFICECGYRTDEMAILNEELQYLRKIKDDYIESDKALELTKLTASFASNLLMASYFDFMSKQQKTEKSVKIENNLYSERQTNTAQLRQIAEIKKDFDKKIKEIKEQHIKEIKEAVEKARKRQTRQNITLVIESKSKKGGKIMENQELRQQYENYCKELKEKITFLKLENERLERENTQWKTYKGPKRDLEKQIAILQDKLEFASSQADTFAKSLKNVYDLIDDLQAKYDEYDDIICPELGKIKNSIPENALKR